MSESVPAYPQPQITEANRALMEGWQRGELHLQHCRDCGQTVFSRGSSVLTAGRARCNGREDPGAAPSSLTRWCTAT